MPPRLALESEDEKLAVILYNAFLPIWNHNWFQGLHEPLPMINSPSTSEQTLSQLQRARLGFYLALVKSTRLLDGQVLLSAADEDDKIIHAILLWLPPRKRLTIGNVSVLFRSGFLTTMRAYGVRGIYRVNYVFESNIARMFTKAKVNEHECGFVQMIAVNPEHAGKGHASKLLAWKLRQHTHEHPGIAVVLDTTTEQGVRAYSKIGFEKIGQIPVRTGTDAKGFKLSEEEAGKDLKARSEDDCVQRIMLYRP